MYSGSSTQQSLFQFQSGIQTLNENLNTRLIQTCWRLNFFSSHILPGESPFSVLSSFESTRQDAGCFSTWINYFFSLNLSILENLFYRPLQYIRDWTRWHLFIYFPARFPEQGKKFTNGSDLRNKAKFGKEPNRAKFGNCQLVKNKAKFGNDPILRPSEI